MPKRQDKKDDSKPGLCRWCSARLVNSVCLLLIPLLLIQLVVAFGLWQFENIPLPERLTREINARTADLLGEERLSLHWEGAAFSSRGEIEFSNILLKNEDGEAVAKCASAWAKVDPFYLIAGKLNLESLSLDGLRLYRPSRLTEGDVRMVILRDGAARLQLHDDVVEIVAARAYFLEMPIVVSGVVDLSLLREEEAPRVPKSLITSYYEATALIEAYSGYRNLLDEPRLGLRLRPGGRDGLLLDADFTARGMREFEGATAENVHVALRDFNPQRLDTVEPVSLSFGQVLHKDHGVVEDLKLWARSPGLNIPKSELSEKSLTELIPPLEVQVMATRIDTFGIVAEGSRARVEMERFPEVSASVAFSEQGQGLSLKAAFDFGSNSGELMVRSDLPVETMMKIPEFAKQAGNLNRTFTWKGPPRIDAAVEIEPGFKIGDVRFRMRTGPTELKGLGFEDSLFEGTVNVERLNVERLELSNPDYFVTGRYEEDYIARTYNLAAEGNIDPRDLNPQMEEWWENLWGDYLFHGPLPHARLGLWGEFGLPFGSKVYVEFKSEDVSYRGIPMDVCNFRVYSVPGLVDLHDLTVRRPEGGAHGRLQWEFPPRDNPERVLYHNHFRLNSTLDLKKAGGLLSSGVETVVQDFEFTLPPIVDARGTTTYYRDGRMPREELNIDAKAMTPLSYKGYPFDYMDAKARLVGGHAAISPLKFGFLGGMGLASIIVNADSERMKPGIEVAAALDHASYQRLLELLKEMGLGDGGEAEPTVLVPETGRFALRLNLTGDTESLQSFTGDGYIRVIDADLKKIRLLGRVSKLLEAASVKLSTVKLIAAESEFFLEPDAIRLPKAQLFGESTVVEARGEIARRDYEMDLDVNVYFLKNIDNKVLKNIFSIVSWPVAKAFQAQVTGPVSDPQTRLNVDPRNIPKFITNILDGLSNTAKDEDDGK